MTPWSYLCFLVQAEEIQDTLNQAGAEGWELVSLERRRGTTYYAVMKRAG